MRRRKEKGNFNTCVKPKLGHYITLPPHHVPNKHIGIDKDVREFNYVMNIYDP